MAGLKGKRIAIIGGCGHVGLPLGVKFALAGAETVLVDIDTEKVDAVNAASFPFLEEDGDRQLAMALEEGLFATLDVSECANRDVIVFVTGTPVDEHLNPKLSEVIGVFDSFAEYFAKDTLVVMRSTLFPGTMDYLYRHTRKMGLEVALSFCPERVAQGYALREIDSLPQIVSAFDEGDFRLAYEIFRHIAPCVLKLRPIEAELSKLMANSWRYLEFAIANQFYMIAESNGVDFYRVYDAIRYDYKRAKAYKSPGLAAGPCLFKDTMQLASYFNNRFYMGHAAMLVNEGLTSFIVERVCLELSSDSLWGKKISLLGMTFKADSDDVRESLSFKLRKELAFRGAEVLCHDPYVDPSSVDMVESLDCALEGVDLVVVATPHSDYRDLKTKKPIVDVWGCQRNSELEVLPGFSDPKDN